MRMVLTGGLEAVLLAALSLQATAADFFVAPDAAPGGRGSIGQPWTLSFALSHPSGIRPGDTVWLRGGTYTGKFTSTISGTASQPIVVRQYPGERARIDGGPGNLTATLLVFGQHAWYWGFEIFSSDTKRRSTQNGSGPTDLNRSPAVFTAQDTNHPGLRFINLVVHDATDGIGTWKTSPDTEIYGNLIFNNGWDGATDRGHGHGIYGQNQTGTKKITDNIVFNNFGNGINLYGSSAAYLDNIELTGNTVFNAGAPSIHGTALNLLFGGGNVAHNGRILSNTLAGVGGSNIGYSAGTSDFIIQDNFFGQPGGPDFNGIQKNLIMAGNRFFDDPWNLNISSYPSNIYYRGVRPTGTFVYVRPNAYEPGRANITVYNWDRNATVAVDVSSILAVGASYELRNAQDYFGSPVLSGVYTGGALTLPMTGLSVVGPIGGDVVPPPTGPEFNAFVVLTKPNANGKRRAPAQPVVGPPPVRRTPGPH